MSSNVSLKHRVVAVTGHRPKHLGGYNHVTDYKLVLTAKAFVEGYQPAKVIVGMAQGWDQAVATACIYSGIPFIAVIPFRGQEAKWPEAARARYWSILAQAEKVIVAAPGGYTPGAMNERNRILVTLGDIVVALWNGDPGTGTGRAVAEARKQGKVVRNAWDYFQKVLEPA